MVKFEVKDGYLFGNIADNPEKIFTILNFLQCCGKRTLIMFLNLDKQETGLNSYINLIFFCKKASDFRRMPPVKNLKLCNQSQDTPKILTRLTILKIKFCHKNDKNHWNKTVRLFDNTK